MSIFDPVWAHEGSTRAPTTAETASGFGCGPADPDIFNQKFQEYETAINALGGGDPVQTSREVNTAEGLQGGGNLAADLVLRLDINGLDAETGIASGDLIVIYDVSEGIHRKMTRANFVSGLGGGGSDLEGGENIGTGTGNVFSGVSGADLQFRKLLQGTGISITTVSDDVVIAFADYDSALTVE